MVLSETFRLIAQMFVASCLIGVYCFIAFRQIREDRKYEAEKEARKKAKKEKKRLKTATGS